MIESGELNPLVAVILGIIQGLTEFLPVSSSGHLELGKELFGFELNRESSLFFTVVVHAATALSTIVVYRKDIWELILGLFEFKWNDATRYVSFIVISMIPVAVVGLFFEEEIEAFFEGRIVLVGCMLLVTGLLLWLTHRAGSSEGKVNSGRAFIVGAAQAVAVLPGISRSGSTIATSLLLGISREQAAKFSFLMVLPPILGAMALKSKDVMEAPAGTVNMDMGMLSAAFIAAFISGLFACKWMVSLVKKSKLSWFAIYCGIVGAIAIAAGLLS